MIFGRNPPRILRIQKLQKILDRFIESYTIMNYETTKYGGRAGQEAQQGDDSAQAITIKSKGNQILAGRIRGIATTGVSICARSWKTWGTGNCSGRRKGNDSCQTSPEHSQSNADAKKEEKGKYRRYSNRSAGDLFERKWDLKRIPGRWNLSLSLTG